MALSSALLIASVFPAQGPLPALRVADSGRYIKTAERTPFFWPGDTAWELPNWLRTTKRRGLSLKKPVIDLEPRYENHPVSWKPEDLGWFVAVDVRQAAYASMFSGAAGHTFGHHAIWQMYDNGREPVSFVQRTWKTVLDDPGTAQMGVMKRTLLACGWPDLTPRADLVGPRDFCLLGGGHQLIYRSSTADAPAGAIPAGQSQFGISLLDGTILDGTAPQTPDSLWIRTGHPELREALRGANDAV